MLAVGRYFAYAVVAGQYVAFVEQNVKAAAAIRFDRVTWEAAAVDFAHILVQDLECQNVSVEVAEELRTLVAAQNFLAVSHDQLLVERD